MFATLSTTRLVDAFLLAKSASGLSPLTQDTYRSRLYAFSRHCPRLPRSPEAIEAFLCQVGGEASTKHAYFRVLRSFYRWLQGRKLIKTNPMDVMEPPRMRARVARALTPEELQRLLGHWQSPHIQAFLWLLADTGLRLSEAHQIGKQDIGPECVTVAGKAGERPVPISPFVRNMVVDLPGEKPFAQRWKCWKAASLAVRRAFKRAGITGRRASAHTLRHTFVRLWEGDESVLVGIMGWTSPQMLKVYRPYDLKRAVEQHREHSPARAAASLQSALF